MAQETEKAYGLTLEKRSKLLLTGVTDVERFDEGEVVVRTHGGRLTVTGAQLHVASLTLEDGRLAVDGTVDGMVWDGAGPVRRGGFFRRALG